MTIRAWILAALLALLPLGAEAANCNSNPFTLTNGQTADATQVMANFNNLLNCSNNNLAHNGANSDLTSLTGLTTPLSASQGGTGATTLLSNGVLIGNATSPVTGVAPSTAGNLLTSTGTAWASQGGGWTLIQTKVATTASLITFTSGLTATYDQYVFIVSNLVASTNGTTLDMQISEDGGVSYKASNYQWTRFVTSAAATSAATGSASDTQIPLMTNISNTPGQVGALEIHLYNPGPPAVLKNITFQGSNFATGGNLLFQSGAGVYAADGNPINGIAFFPPVGTISTTISLYGVTR